MRFTPLLAPLAEDLRRWFLASGCPAASDSVACIAVRVQGEPLARQISLAHRPAEHAHLLLTLIRHLTDDDPGAPGAE